MKLTFPFDHTNKIIELGGGTNPLIRPNVDVRPSETTDIVADFNKPLPIPSAAYEGVYSAYSIEHISWRNIKKFISEIYRILAPGGSAFIVTANLYEQCKSLIKDEWTSEDICRIFGDQNYSGDDWVSNAHYCGFSPEYAMKLFREAGFSRVMIIPHPNCKTDMIIEARRPDSSDPNRWTTTDRLKAYNIDYFDGGSSQYGGYSDPWYCDQPINYTIANKIADKKPKSVLELGCARGYLLKKIQDKGIHAVGIDISEHCYLTRVTNNIELLDLTILPLPFGDKQFDLCVSSCLLEHIPANLINEFMKELKRVSNNQYHLVTTNVGNDRTKTIINDINWWRTTTGIDDIYDISSIHVDQADIPQPDGKIKLNIGSFTTMFYHGWINIDTVDLSHYADHNGFMFKQFDITEKLQYINNSVDAIFCIHVLEHLSYEHGRSFLYEAHRVLQPGGILRILVPDAESLIEKYRTKSMSSFNQVNRGCNNTNYEIQKLWSLLLDNHKAAYDSQNLIDILQHIGFSARRVGFRESSSTMITTQTVDMFPEFSIIIEAVK